jgi:hypothetical protein
VEVDGCAVNLYNRVKRNSIRSSEVDMFCNGRCRAQCYERRVGVSPSTRNSNRGHHSGENLITYPLLITPRRSRSDARRSLSLPLIKFGNLLHVFRVILHRPVLQLASVPKFGGSGSSSSSSYQRVISLEVLCNLLQRRVPCFDVIPPDDSELDGKPNTLFK